MLSVLSERHASHKFCILVPTFCVREGANGMGIPIGKLSLYCAAGGIAPHRVMPVVLDVGTDNEELLNHPFYLGVQKPRITGDKYFHLVDEFMRAVRFRWPNVLVQFEDFSSDKAQVSLSIIALTQNRFLVSILVYRLT
mmetsp:Transcript_9078/g.27157  ORF Transcript_9078/g.27157 Transcript_9078/m.27157 type:complete len:139 (+) Transcript_9078:956-1372(+)